MPNFCSRDLNLFSREMYDTQIVTRRYQVSDASALASIYYHTIHNINIRDYSIEQVNAWAPTSSLELDGWKKKWEKLSPIVAVSNDIIVGFTEFEPNGHIDCFYVHHGESVNGVGEIRHGVLVSPGLFLRYKPEQAFTNKSSLLFLSGICI